MPLSWYSCAPRVPPLFSQMVMVPLPGLKPMHHDFIVGRHAIRRKRLDMVKATLRERGVPKALQRRIKSYYAFYLNECSDVATEQRILSELCPPLRTEVRMLLSILLMSRGMNG